MARYLVGIDLGTTHTVVTYFDTWEQPGPIQLFQIEQLVALGEVAARALLPSMRYHPAEGELARSDIQLPWPPLDDFADIPEVVLGELARSLGSRSQGRFVTSAKSWLSYASVDRTAAILPWGGADDVSKVSPVLASASYLAQVRAAWNHRFPSHPLEQQDMVVTVPASFDEVARALTVEAARIAGLPNVRLVEEPQAVCYDWLWRHQADLKQALANIRLILVCDVGGGTTDLTLIKVEMTDSEPKLTRIGVGDHLMLGGDNIDLALAHRVEGGLATGKRLSAAEMFQLIEQCRTAKERLLAEDAPERARITLLGAGAKLIGGARSAELSRAEVKDLVLEGFFPKVRLFDRPHRKRSGVVEFGLPYAADPAISKHIAAFLGYYQQACQEALGQDRVPDVQPLPDALLLNGGMFRSPLLAKRLTDIIASWGTNKLRVLNNPHPDLAVAYGAVAYSLARHGQHVRIGGGSARSYFLVIDSEETERPQGVCILPRGTEEGYDIYLSNRTFSLRLGQPVRFHLVSSTGDAHYHPGDLVAIDGEAFLPLPPLAMVLGTQDQQQRAGATVQLVASLTEVGTLQIRCVTVADPKQRWDLEFELRRVTTPKVSIVGVTIHPRFAEAAERIRLCYGKKSKEVAPTAIKALRPELEKLLGPRTAWDTPLLRELFGVLLEGQKHRRRSPDHERLWLSLAGYCLRPGFGYPLDDWRVDQLWDIYDQGIQYIKEAQNWSEWWTLWRRVAGGLGVAAQEKILADIADYLNPAKARPGKGAKILGYDNIVRLAGGLEHLSSTQKTQLGEWLLRRLEKPSEPEYSWWAVGRIGARVPFYGSTHKVVNSETAAQWLERMLEYDWKRLKTIGFAAILIARMSGDRERDIDPDLREQVLTHLRSVKVPESWIRMVAQMTELDEADNQGVFGEALPSGLRLLG